jgi:predicted Zn-dependent protease
VEYGTGQRVRVHSFSAYVAPFRGQSSAGTLVGEAGFVVDGELVYEILGFTREGSYRRYRDVFLNTISSYDRLRDRKALEIQAHRIALYRVPNTMALGDALARAGVDKELFADLALLNNLQLDESVEAGTLLKVVTGSPGGGRSFRP